MVVGLELLSNMIEVQRVEGRPMTAMVFDSGFMSESRVFGTGWDGVKIAYYVWVKESV
jgi:hypothetical protein